MNRSPLASAATPVGWSRSDFVARPTIERGTWVVAVRLVEEVVDAATEDVPGTVVAGTVVAGVSTVVAGTWVAAVVAGAVLGAADGVDAATP
jgi:hypothetical protein